MNKYRNRPTVVEGLRFDSKAEARRWMELKLLEKAGEIHGLTRQVSWPLIVEGAVITHYRSDFEYFDQDGKRIVEDLKSPASITPVYRLKRKLMKAVWGVTIREVSA
ncbi:MAG: DUF1064 domain-containing protein [Patescibacteria group bacterium]|nr:DUF1064 domain-containing protein [Patescibacteria group bacterium]